MSKSQQHESEEHKPKAKTGAQSMGLCSIFTAQWQCMLQIYKAIIYWMLILRQWSYIFVCTFTAPVMLQGCANLIKLVLLTISCYLIVM